MQLANKYSHLVLLQTSVCPTLVEVTKKREILKHTIDASEVSVCQNQTCFPRILTVRNILELLAVST